MTTQAITANRPSDYNLDELCLIQSKLTEKIIVQRINQSTIAGFQLQTQSTSVILYPHKNNTETTESIFPTQVTQNRSPNSSVLIPGITTPLQVPIKTIRSVSDIHIEPNISEKFTSQVNFSGITSHQFQIQNTASLRFSQFNSTQRNIPMYIPFTDHFNQIQNKQTVSSQPNRSNDQTFMINTITTTVPTLLWQPWFRSLLLILTH